MNKWVSSLTDKDSRFLGFKGTIVECDEWSKKKFKKRNFNILLEQEIDNMQEDIAKLRQAIDMGMVKQDMGTARIAMLQKELRGSIKQIGDEKILMDKQGLILAGADRALREMLTIFRDDPIEGPLQEASMGVWTKILQEES
jgi:hypothetical protein